MKVNKFIRGIRILVWAIWILPVAGQLMVYYLINFLLNLLGGSDRLVSAKMLYYLEKIVVFLFIIG